MRIFGSVEPQTESIYPFLYIIIFQRWVSLEPPSFTLGEINICARGLFCMKLNFEQLLFEAFFDALHIFGGVEPQTEFTFPFWILVCIRTSAHLRERLRCCLFTFMAWYVSIKIGGYGLIQSNGWVGFKSLISLVGARGCSFFLILYFQRLVDSFFAEFKHGQLFRVVESSIKFYFNKFFFDILHDYFLFFKHSIAFDSK